MPPEFNPQAAFEQVTQHLDGLQASQDGMKRVLIQTADIQTAMLGVQQQMLETQNRLVHTQNRMLDYMKFTFDQQAKWNERQDEFNIILLDEIRELKGDVREIKKKSLVKLSRGW
ncbi:MAG: hypothetical protein ACRYFK_06980 [Janthinobacterium lividum]